MTLCDKMLYNVMIMRHIDNITRKYAGQKWLDYKDQWAIKRTERNLKAKNLI